MYCKKSRPFSKGYVEGAIWARVWLTKSWIVWVCKIGDSLWEKTSPDAMLEGNEGVRNCEIVNYGWGAEAITVETTGKDCWANIVCKEVRRVCNYKMFFDCKVEL